MATFTKTLLSGGTNGKNIKLAATATPGTTIHTAASGTTSVDEVWLFAHNQDTGDLIRIDVDVAGTGTTGLVVYLEFA